MKWIGKWLCAALILASVAWGKPSTDLPVQYKNPVCGEVSFVVPATLRGAYERIYTEPQTSQSGSGKYDIYSCVLPNDFITNLRDKFPLVIYAGVYPNPGVDSFDDTVLRTKADMAKRNAENAGVVEELSVVEIAGIKWVRIDQKMSDQPNQINGVLFITCAGSDFRLLLRLGANGAGSGEMRPGVERALFNRFYPSLLKLVGSMQLKPNQ